MEIVDSKKIAEDFISLGQLNQQDEFVIADSCDALIRTETRSSLKHALKLARKFHKKSRAFNGPIRLMALRCLARLNHLSGYHEPAKELYQEARVLCNGDNITKGKIDRILTDVYMYLGDFSSAKRSAKSAISIFQKADQNNDLFQAKVNFANILHRQDRHREAEVIYKQAASFFGSQKDKINEARCNYNRANCLMQLFDFKKAEILYQDVRKIRLDEGYALDANDALYGIAWLKMLSGKFHVALRYLKESEDIFREGGDQRGVALCVLDKAEVFLSLNLLEDALEAANDCGAIFKKLGLNYELAKSQYFKACALFGLGRITTAHKYADLSLKMFRHEGNQGFSAAVTLLLAKMCKDKDDQRKLFTTARNKFKHTQLPLWEAICDIQLIRISSRPTYIIRRLQANSAVKSVPQLYTLWHNELGDHFAKQGDQRSAIKHWRLAAQKLDKVRIQLPPLEMRDAFTRTVNLPHSKLIRAKLDTSIDKAAAWSERHKTAGLWSPVNLEGVKSKERDKVQEKLGELSNQVALLSQYVVMGEERSGVISGATNQLKKIQKSIRNELTKLEQDKERDPDRIENIQAAITQESFKLPIIQFHINEKDIIAFIHHNGNTRSYIYKDGKIRLAENLRRWRFLLESELLSRRKLSKAKHSSEVKLFKELGEWFWKPLEIDANQQKVLIIPEGEIANLPWNAIISNDKYLVETHLFLQAPSLRHYLAAKKNRTNARNIELFRGKAIDLPHLDKEIEVVHLLSNRKSNIHKPSIRKDWFQTKSAKVWHFAGHAVLRNDNPFYSFLMMEDGPLFAADFRLQQIKVNLVTLAACRSGEQTALPGEESTGLVRSLLEMGARNVIAGLWPVSDVSTSLWVKSFYKHFFRNNNISESLRHANLMVKEKFPSACHWAAYSLIGAGN